MLFRAWIVCLLPFCSARVFIGKFGNAPPGMGCNAFATRIGSAHIVPLQPSFIAYHDNDTTHYFLTRDSHSVCIERCVWGGAVATEEKVYIFSAIADWVQSVSDQRQSLSSDMKENDDAFAWAMHCAL